MSHEQTSNGMHTYPLTQYSSSHSATPAAGYPNQAPVYIPSSTGGSSNNTMELQGSDSLDTDLHSWIQEGQITSTEQLREYVITDRLESGKQVYRCGRPECRRENPFTTRNTVIAHIRSVHLQERPFICTTCNATFGRKQDADRHVQSKNRGKIYQCRYCSELFSRKDYAHGVHELWCKAGPK